MAEGKKQVPLRLSEDLYIALAKWADDEFRSVNGQIEYLLNACVKEHRKTGGILPRLSDGEEPESEK